MHTRERDGEGPLAPVGTAPVPVASRHRIRTLSSLGNRDYRWLWIGYLFSFGAIMMQMVARGWLVYDLSASTFYLSLVWSMWGLAVLLFSPIGGVIADRLGRRTILLADAGYDSEHHSRQGRSPGMASHGGPGGDAGCFPPHCVPAARAGLGCDLRYQAKAGGLCPRPIAGGTDEASPGAGSDLQPLPALGAFSHAS